MSKHSGDFLINDHFFLEALSCPLKIHHLVKHRKIAATRPVYRQRNKLNLRDAVALRFSNCKHTSNELEKACDETEKWLHEDEVAVCGAVLQIENVITRIPILIKKDTRFTVIQIHGKLRKPSERSTIESAKKRSTNVYLLKAAYRAEVLQRCYPDAEIEVEFYFPDKDFKSRVNGLNRISEIDSADDPAAIKRDLMNHFSKVDATAGVADVAASLPENVAHSRFSGFSVSSVIDLIRASDPSGNQFDVNIHNACRYCDFRKPESDDKGKGCWETWFPAEGLSRPDRHIFELMGHGNRLQSGSGVYYQEQVEITDGLHSFELMKKYGGPTITIQQRRNLQILTAKNESVPRLWLKQGLKKILDLPFPLHFIDFEAATCALPMRRGSYPYRPIYFQFSCHSITENGEIAHTQWLDEEPRRVDPHKAFTKELSQIPGIFDGTLIQYSPFEKQAVNNLIQEFRRNSMLNYKEIEQLEAIRAGTNKKRENRFFDLNASLRNYYHNCFLDEGLGLKQMLNSVAEWEKSFGNAEEQNQKERMDPYLSIQRNGSQITDGSMAMHAWIAMKNGLLSPAEQTIIPAVLKKYCALDSWSMVVIYRHLMNYLFEMTEKDFVL
jgi:hypothetical protein